MSKARTSSTVGLLVTLGAVGGATVWSPGIEPSEPPPVQTDKFRHGGKAQGNHVSYEWVEPKPGGGFKHEEVARDCEGCHQWEATELAGIPSETHRNLGTQCKDCHTRGLIQADLGEDPGERKARLETIRSRQNSFLHLDHSRDATGLACRDCHAADLASPRSFPVDIPVPQGASFCGDCHEETPSEDRRDLLDRLEREGKLDRGVLVQGFNERLNDTARQRLTDADFYHRQHMEDPAVAGRLQDQRAADGGSCTVCHPSLGDEQRKDELVCRVQKFVTGECGDCHKKSERGEPIDFQPQEVPGSSLSKNTFRHSFHLNFGASDPAKSSTAGYEVLTEQSCTACHEHTRLTSSTQEDCYDYKSVLESGHPSHSYEGCAVCHDTWTEGLQHESWAERGCVDCHEFPATDLKTERGTAVVAQRARDVLFKFSRSAHPFISTSELAQSGGVLAEDCSQCHRAPVQELPSRITESKFDHAVHMAPLVPGQEEAYSRQCVRCHEAELVEGTGSSLELGATFEHPDGFLRSWNPGACKDCHFGSLAIEETPAAVDEARPPRVISFPHSKHLGEGKTWQGEEMNCTTCHSVKEGQPFAKVGVDEAASNCTQCHGHEGPEKILATAGIGQDQVQHCNECHSFDYPSAVEDDLYTVAKELTLGSMADPQYHVPAGMKCTDCHEDPPRALVDPVFGIAVDTAVRKGRGTFHEDGKPQNCLGCHWGDLSEDDERQFNLQGRPRTQPIGSDLRNFPGKDAAAPR